MRTRCNWCMTPQDGNLTDKCNACGKDGYLMDLPTNGSYGTLKKENA